MYTVAVSLFISVLGKLIHEHQRFMSKNETKESYNFIQTKGGIMGIFHGVSQIVRGRSLLFILISQTHFPLSFPID